MFLNEFGLLVTLALATPMGHARHFSGYTPLSNVAYTGSSRMQHRVIQFRLSFGEGDGAARTRARVSAILLLGNDQVKADRNERPGGDKNHTFSFDMGATEDWKTAIFYLVEDDTADASVYELTNPSYAPGAMTPDATVIAHKWTPTHQWAPAHKWKPKHHRKLRKRRVVAHKKPVAVPAPKAKH